MNILEDYLKKKGWSFLEATRKLKMSRMTLYKMRQGFASRETVMQAVTNIFDDKIDGFLFMLQNGHIPDEFFEVCYKYPDRILVLLDALNEL